MVAAALMALGSKDFMDGSKLNFQLCRTKVDPDTWRNAQGKLSFPCNESPSSAPQLYLNVRLFIFSTIVTITTIVFLLILSSKNLEQGMDANRSGDVSIQHLLQL